MFQAWRSRTQKAQKKQKAQKEQNWVMVSSFLCLMFLLCPFVYYLGSGGASIQLVVLGVLGSFACEFQRDAFVCQLVHPNAW